MGRNASPRWRTFQRKAPKGSKHLGFCINYVGSGYRGLQLQAHAPTNHTVEGEFVLALNAIGLIPGVRRGRIVGDHHHFARSCRTDRGVHAARNLISLFVPEAKFDELGGCEGIVKKMNAHLPDTLRVVHVAILMVNFIPRHCCCRRAYRYAIPAYALDRSCDSWETYFDRHPDALSALRDADVHFTTPLREDNGYANSVDSSSTGPTGTSRDFVSALRSEGNREALRMGLPPHINLRSADELPKGTADAASDCWLAQIATVVSEANSVLQEKLCGSHRFHNFTVDPDGPRGNPSASVSPLSDEALRMIYRANIAERVFLFKRDVGVTRRRFQDSVAFLPTGTASVLTTEGDRSAPGLPLHLPFVVFQVEGASFLMNMIRKMVGLLLAVLRGTRATLVDELLSPHCRAVCPMAPGSYLLLALSCYHGYDNTVRTTPTSKFSPLHDQWEGSVSEEAERFMGDVIARDIIDVDICQLPPLGTVLAARDAEEQSLWAQQREREDAAAQTFDGDAHLAEMKEYKPARIDAVWARVSEMTMFLRQLRVHNWSIRHVDVPASSKAALEAQNMEARRQGHQGKGSSEGKESAGVLLRGTSGAKRNREGEPEECPEGSAPETGPSGPVHAVIRCTEEVENDEEKPPPLVDDGWIYVGSCRREEQEQRAAYFNERWRRRRKWEYCCSASGVTATVADAAAVADAGSMAFASGHGGEM